MAAPSFAKVAEVSFHAHLKVLLATAKSDPRASFDDLWAAAKERLGEDSRSGTLFVFGNLKPGFMQINAGQA